MELKGLSPIFIINLVVSESIMKINFKNSVEKLMNLIDDIRSGEGRLGDDGVLMGY